MCSPVLPLPQLLKPPDMPPPADTRFAAYLRQLCTTAPKSVFCLPCTLSRGDFVCVAEFDARPPVWFSASCLQALLDHDDDVNVEEEIRKFKRTFKALYTQYNAVNVDEIDNVLVFEASLVKSNSNTTTCSVYALPSGHLICFDSIKHCLCSIDLVLLQRTDTRHASTFDAVFFRKQAASDRAVELRLVDKNNLQPLRQWAETCGVPMAASSGAPVEPSWILDAFTDEISVAQIVRWIEGESDDESSEADDSEWCASDTDSDDCVIVDDTGSSDEEEFDADAAAAELRNLQ